MIVVKRTAPLLTVQDRGRTGYLADGVTHGGALDALSLDVANALVGNASGAAALEGCLGGAAFRCERDATFALTGAEIIATHNGTALPSNRAIAARAGDTIVVERIMRGTAWYLAVRGGIDVPVLLGSRSTIIAAGIGGVDGGPIKTGITLRVGDGVNGDAIARDVPMDLRTPGRDEPIPLTPAPRADALDDPQWRDFYATPFTVSRAMSRVGYRLDGPAFTSKYPGDLPSEPACAGAIQLPPEGRPIVLMAEHPTIGGYPLIGVVASHALSRFAQCGPGSTVRFRPMSADEAIEAGRRQHDAFALWAHAAS